MRSLSTAESAASLSLTYRLAIRNGKAKENPARFIPHKAEHDERTRILAVEEEKRLRKVILKRFPKQLPGFDKVRRQPADPSGMRHDSLLEASPSSKALKDSSDEY